MLAVGLVLAVALSFGGPVKVDALSGSQFNAGRIIDDGVFYAGNSMSINDIQVFLNSKVPQCDNNGTEIYSGSTTRAQYGTSRGYPPPYTCLKDYSQVAPTITNGPSDYCTGGIPGGNKSAATIIYEVSAACGVNPKVLIVLIQKEQSLVTDEWPWSIQYRSATGYGCPDSAPCDSEYYGFFNQVYQAAKAFKRYRANPTNYNYRAGRANNIFWHPNAGCGFSSVFIDSQATAGLYIYTPYRPNQAALDNLYGTGDSCSSYGNRNFWRLFNDWFGTTFAPGYSWQWVSQYAYTNAAKTTPKSLTNLAPGEKAFVGFTARNTGGNTWTNSGPNAVMVGTAGPMERSSNFSDGSSWYTGTRPAFLKEASVAPGEIGTFEFWITAPTTPGKGGTYNERFNILASGITWLNDVGLSYHITAQQPTYSWQWQSQYAYTDATKTTAKGLNGILPGDRVYMGVTAKNTGNMTWTNSGSNPLRLGTHTPGRQSPFAEGTWLNSTRPATMQEASVPPGGTATFEFWITVPNIPGGHNERFNLVAEGVTWLNDVGLSYGIGVAPKVYSWQWQAQYAYTDAAKTTPKSLDGLNPGERVYVGFRAKNTGNMTWSNTGSNPMRVGTANPLERTSPFKDNTWLGPSRPVALQESSVAPGATGTFEFWLTTPNSPGTHHERYNLVAEGLQWLNDIGLSYGIRVQ